MSAAIESSPIKLDLAVRRGDMVMTGFNLSCVKGLRVTHAVLEFRCVQRNGPSKTQSGTQEWRLRPMDLRRNLASSCCRYIDTSCDHHFGGFQVILSP